MRIAVLEDDPTQADTVQQWLLAAGLQVSVHGLSRDLMRDNGRESFDLYLLDWIVPDITGKEVLTWLRNTPIDMTDKEFELAVFLFNNIGSLISRGHLLESVWGGSAEVATRTIDTHVSRVQSKLALRGIFWWTHWKACQLAWSRSIVQGALP